MEQLDLLTEKPDTTEQVTKDIMKNFLAKYGKIQDNEKEKKRLGVGSVIEITNCFPFSDFQVDAMEKFIEESTIPIVTLWTSDPNSHTYASKFFNGGNDKAMLFLNLSTEHDALQSIYKDVAASYKGKYISFLLADIDAGQGAFQMNVDR